MKRILFSMLTAALLAGISLAQSSVQSQTNASASQSASASADKSGAQATASNQVVAGSTIQATLTKPVDARKNKAGDEVVAKTTEDVKSNGKVVIPKGSKIIGHVTEAKARGKGESDSMVGIAFDRATLKDGREMPLSATIQAVARSEDSAAASMADESSMAGGSAGGMSSGRAAAPGAMGSGRGVGAITGTVANTTSAVGSAAGGTVSGATSAASMGRVTSGSQGVIGLKGLSLNGAATNSTQGSVISSNSQNVHLDSGTQMVLRVNSQ